MATESSAAQGMRTGAHGGMPAQTVAECSLLSLQPALCGHLWPAERVVVGLRRQRSRAKEKHKICCDTQQHVECGLCVGGLPAPARTCQGDITVEDRGLAHLDMAGTFIGEVGAERLAGVLGKCKMLAHLDLSWSEINFQGAANLAGVLGECKALVYLDLGGNQIGVEGAERLAGALGESKSLAPFFMRGNYIGHDGAEKLAGVLGGCKALTYFDMMDVNMVQRERG
eukprot:818051-Rhodomonas_salina.1